MLFDGVSLQIHVKIFFVRICIYLTYMYFLFTLFSVCFCNESGVKIQIPLAFAGGAVDSFTGWRYQCSFPETFQFGLVTPLIAKWVATLYL